jgi:hypothetical protein
MEHLIQKIDAKDTVVSFYTKFFKNAFLPEDMVKYLRQTARVNFEDDALVLQLNQIKYLEHRVTRPPSVLFAPKHQPIAGRLFGQHWSLD